MSSATHTFDADTVRAQFPILHQTVRGGKPLVYLDNAATTQKPLAVIDAISGYYRNDNSNVHRAVHTLAERATVAYDDARRSVQRFVGANDEREIVFTSGTTGGINLVAASWGRTFLGPDSEVIVSEIEHHSNIVPWQIVCKQTGATLRVAPVLDDGSLDLAALKRLITDKTALVALVHASNALGSINPIERVIEMAHAHGAKVLIDGAQAIPHLPVDVASLDVDFYSFSGHKVYGPTGIGVLYGKLDLLSAMPPFQGGGDMIDRVSFEGTTFAEPPARFEAGTPHIAGAIGLAAALDWVDAIGRQNIARYEDDLLQYGTALLQNIDGLRIIGTAEHKVGVLSFVVDGAHSQDIGTLLDMEGVAIRTGHHCAEPAMKRFGVPATARASLAVYNTREDLDRLADALRVVIRMLR